jgi:hypothetical protein
MSKMVSQFDRPPKLEVDLREELSELCSSIHACPRGVDAGPISVRTVAHCWGT